MKKILFIDNFDSFTYNLVDEFEKRNSNVEVFRNNVSLAHIEQAVSSMNPDLIVLSPGPSAPVDAGNTLSVIERFYREVPLFGVCLGYEAMIEAFGGKIERAPEIIHGRASYIRHEGERLFKGLENPLAVGRYHSLYAPVIPSCFIQTASHGEMNMAVRHRDYFVEGVLFHPESILTTLGGRIIENLLREVSIYQKKPKSLNNISLKK